MQASTPAPAAPPRRILPFQPHWPRVTFTDRQLQQTAEFEQAARSGKLAPVERAMALPMPRRVEVAA